MQQDRQSETLADRAEKVLVAYLVEALPGFDEFLAKDPKAAGWIADQEQKIEKAVRDDDRILLDRALASWTKAMERVNSLLAEEYRKANADPALWELRYVKWMEKVTYIRFESKLGEFYLVPRMPTRRPKATHWYTADELIDMVHPMTAMAIMAFEQLPVRPDTLAPVGVDEKHLHIDATGPTVRLTYDFPGGLHHARKGVR